MGKALEYHQQHEGHTVHAWYEPDRQTTVFQFEDNFEACMEVEDSALVEMEIAKGRNEFLERYLAWVADCERYEGHKKMRIED